LPAMNSMSWEKQGLELLFIHHSAHTCANFAQQVV
jgi:hypothetical protein